MLGDLDWRPVSVHEVAAAFLRGEPHHWRDDLPRDLHHVIDAPDLADGEQNAVRWRLLHTYRRHLMGEIPPDTAWHRVDGLRDEHLDELWVIARSDFFDGDDFDLASATSALTLTLQTSPTEWTPPILWGHRRSGPFTIIEGNHRLTAYAGAPTGDLDIPVYVGLSPSPCYWHAADPPRKLVHDMWS